MWLIGLGLAFVGVISLVPKSKFSPTEQVVVDKMQWGAKCFLGGLVGGLVVIFGGLWLMAKLAGF